MSKCVIVVLCMSLSLSLACYDMYGCVIVAFYMSLSLFFADVYGYVIVFYLYVWACKCLLFLCLYLSLSFFVSTCLGVWLLCCVFLHLSFLLVAMCMGVWLFFVCFSVCLHLSLSLIAMCMGVWFFFFLFLCMSLSLSLSCCDMHGCVIVVL